MLAYQNCLKRNNLTFWEIRIFALFLREVILYYSNISTVTMKGQPAAGKLSFTLRLETASLALSTANKTHPPAETF